MKNKDYIDMNEEKLIILNQYRDNQVDSPVVINGHYSSEPDYTDMDDEQLEELANSYKKNGNQSNSLPIGIRMR